MIITIDTKDEMNEIDKQILRTVLGIEESKKKNTITNEIVNKAFRPAHGQTKEGVLYILKSNGDVGLTKEQVAECMGILPQSAYAYLKKLEEEKNIIGSNTRPKQYYLKQESKNRELVDSLKNAPKKITTMG